MNIIKKLVLGSALVLGTTTVSTALDEIAVPFLNYNTAGTSVQVTTTPVDVKVEFINILAPGEAPFDSQEFTSVAPNSYGVVSVNFRGTIPAEGAETPYEGFDIANIKTATENYMFRISTRTANTSDEYKVVSYVSVFDQVLRNMASVGNAAEGAEVTDGSVTPAKIAASANSGDVMLTTAGANVDDPTEVAWGKITNANIADAAADLTVVGAYTGIAGSKIDPNFGARDVTALNFTATDKLIGANLEIAAEVRADNNGIKVTKDGVIMGMGTAGTNNLVGMNVANAAAGVIKNTTYTNPTLFTSPDGTTMNFTADKDGNVVAKGTLGVTGNTTIAGTLGVTGATTLASATVTDAEIGNLKVTDSEAEFAGIKVGALGVTENATFAKNVTANDKLIGANLEIGTTDDEEVLADNNGVKVTKGDVIMGMGAVTEGENTENVIAIAKLGDGTSSAAGVIQTGTADPMLFTSPDGGSTKNFTADVEGNVTAKSLTVTGTVTLPNGSIENTDLATGIAQDKITKGNVGQVLVSGNTVSEWVDASTITVGTASAVAASAAGKVLTSVELTEGGFESQWTAPADLTVGTATTATTATSANTVAPAAGLSVITAINSEATAKIAPAKINPGTAGQILTTLAGATAWTNPENITVGKATNASQIITTGNNSEKVLLGAVAEEVPATWGKITSAYIADGTITNADIAAYTDGNPGIDVAKIKLVGAINTREPISTPNSVYLTQGTEAPFTGAFAQITDAYVAPKVAGTYAGISSQKINFTEGTNGNTTFGTNNRKVNISTYNAVEPGNIPTTLLAIDQNTASTNAQTALITSTFSTAPATNGFYQAGLEVMSNFPADEVTIARLGSRVTDANSNTPTALYLASDADAIYVEAGKSTLQAMVFTTGDAGDLVTDGTVSASFYIIDGDAVLPAGTNGQIVYLHASANGSNVDLDDSNGNATQAMSLNETMAFIYLTNRWYKLD